MLHYRCCFCCQDKGYHAWQWLILSSTSYAFGTARKIAFCYLIGMFGCCFLCNLEKKTLSFALWLKKITTCPWFSDHIWDLQFFPTPAIVFALVLFLPDEFKFPGKRIRMWDMEKFIFKGTKTTIMIHNRDVDLHSRREDYWYVFVTKQRFIPADTFSDTSVW